MVLFLWHPREGKTIGEKKLDQGLGVRRIDRREIWGNFLGVRKMFHISILLVLSWLIYLSKLTELYTWKGWILLYINYTSINLTFKKWHCLVVLSHSSFALQWNWTALYLFAIYIPFLENCHFIPLQNCLWRLSLFSVNRGDLLILCVKLVKNNSLNFFFQFICD